MLILIYRHSFVDVFRVRMLFTNLLSKVFSLQWDENYVELLKTASNLKHQLAYAREEEPSKVDLLERKISRNEKTIAGVEKKNGVRVRWKESDATFQNAHERLTSKRRSNEMLALHKLASERVFLLELKAKYAGLHTFIFTEILRNSSGATKVCTGSCMFF